MIMTSKITWRRLPSNKVFRILNDRLTGCCSLFKFESIIRHTPKKGYILVMDLIGFRNINERYGKSFGDEVLKKTTSVLRNTFPLNTTICRVRADIFALFLPDNNEGYVLRCIRHAVHKLHKNICIPLNTVFGYCKISSTIDGIHALEYAHIALKQVKQSNGHILYQRFHANILKKINHDMDITHDMYRALENGQFQLYLQPKYDADTNNIVGAEALVRWKHPKKGLIPPNQFIPLFEKNGFITELDEYMWDKTASLIDSWFDHGISPVPVSVNISRAHPLDESLCQRILSVTLKHHIPPELLQLEFTESFYDGDHTALYRTMQSLHQMGFTILVDDFGAGYSSLTMLQNCPADIIKTDKEFLHPKGDAKGDTVISYVIDMIHALNLDIVAEGVENETQLKLVQACGCNIIQGYYYSPPIHYSVFTKKLKALQEKNRLS